MGVGFLSKQNQASEQFVILEIVESTVVWLKEKFSIFILHYTWKELGEKTDTTLLYVWYV